ncbi:MAG: SUF system NifU family Fe-S cluster assembly protein [Planctomycetes bacterium]|nr:SUF system NifU family Fe-S cluster assembly protein [Planctomycetota bacterium]
MTMTKELYQQLILEHNKKPKNFRKIESPTHFAEGFNPLCGDRYFIYLTLNDQQVIEDIAFEGEGCAISKASASMMTQTLKGKTIEQAKDLFDQFRRLVLGRLDDQNEKDNLGKLAVFSGVSKFPARVKCAALSWHTMSGAINNTQQITTE